MRTLQSSNNAWGYGAAPLVQAATKEETERVVFLSDPHFPYEDQQAIASALKLIKSVKPHRVVINGDVNDFVQLSRFNATLDRLDTLQDEIDLGNDFRKAVRKAAPNAILDENEGNHCYRMKRYVAENARALTSLRALEPESLFLYRELEINWHPGAGFRLRPEFLVKHGTLVRKGSGSTAKAEYDNAGISGTSGHTHRLATYRKNGYTANSWTESGCLCRLDPEYIVGAPDWQQGIVMGEFSTKSNSFLMHEVPFHNGMLHLGLKTF